MLLIAEEWDRTVQFLLQVNNKTINFVQFDILNQVASMSIIFIHTFNQCEFIINSQNKPHMHYKLRKSETKSYFLWVFVLVPMLFSDNSNLTSTNVCLSISKSISQTISKTIIKLSRSFCASHLQPSLTILSPLPNYLSPKIKILS